jgi:hypothetical protein
MGEPLKTVDQRSPVLSTEFCCCVGHQGLTLATLYFLQAISCVSSVDQCSWDPSQMSPTSSTSYPHRSAPLGTEGDQTVVLELARFQDIRILVRLRRNRCRREIEHREHPGLIHCNRISAAGHRKRVYSVAVL